MLSHGSLILPIKKKERRNNLSFYQGGPYFLPRSLGLPVLSQKLVLRTSDSDTKMHYNADTTKAGRVPRNCTRAAALSVLARSLSRGACPHIALAQRLKIVCLQFCNVGPAATTGSIVENLLMRCWQGRRNSRDFVASLRDFTSLLLQFLVRGEEISSCGSNHTQ